MTRTLYAGRIGDTVASLYQAGDGKGRVFLAVPSDAQGYPTPVVFTVWDEPDGTQLDNLLAADGTTPITQVVVPASEIQVPGFYGPDGVSADLWLKDPAGVFFRMDASPDAAAAAATAAAAEAVEAKEAAEDAQAAAEAVGALADTQIATQINTPGSQTETSLKTSTADLAVSRTTRPKHVPSLGLFFPEAEGALGDGSTDDTAAIIAADTAAQANGGGIVYFDSSKIYRCNGRLARTFANPGTTPISKPVQWTSGGASSASGQWVTNPLNGGATLDLRYDGSDGLGQAKIDTRGCGRFEIDHLNLTSGGTDNFPFLQTTNTTVHAHHNFIRGNSANQQGSSQQDVFIFGGTDSTLGDGLNAPFQGYGSKVHDNHFDRIRRGFVGRLYCNSVLVKDNVFSTRCGNDGTTGTTTMGGAIEFLGSSSGSGYCTGNIVTGNTIEVPYYKHAVAATYAVGNTFGPNGIWDAQAGSGTAHVAGYLMSTNAIYNTIIDGYHNSAYPLVRDKGMTNTVRTPAQARSSFYPQNSFNRGKVAYVSNGSSGVGPSIMSRQGDYAFMRCSAGSAASPSYPSVYLGTSTATLVTDLVTTSGSNIVSSASAAFVAEQLWMPIAATGLPNNTLIIRYIDATHVELSADATATATGVTAQIGKAPGVGTNTDLIEFTRGGHIVVKGAIGAAASPPAALGTAGNGATVTAVGKDTGFVLTITTASTGTGIGTMATVAWGVAFTGSAAVPGLTPMNQAAAEAMVTNRVWAAPTNSNFVLMSGVGTLPVSTTMIFGVQMLQS